MTTGGEGGMVTTNDEVLWKKMWSYKDHGKSYDAVYNTQRVTLKAILKLSTQERPGEKLYEELLIGDNVTGTSHPKISIAMESKELWNNYRLALETVFEVARSGRFTDLRDLLSSCVNGFNPTSDVVDWMDQSRQSDSRQERQSLKYH